MKQSELGRLVQPFHVMELVKLADDLEAQGRRIVHLSIGEPDFPMSEPVQQALLQAVASNRTRYTPALGLPELRQALSDFYQARFQVHVPAKQIIITSGASAALMYACLAMINPGREALLADPGYPCNKTFVQQAGGKPVFIPTREEHDFQPSWEDLEAHWTEKTAGVLLASPNNPTGTQLSLAAMRKIIEGVSKLGGFAIFDEIYQLLSYDQPARSVLQTCGVPGTDTPVVVINSFSKYFGMTGLRLGWMVVPEELVNPVEKLAQNLSICPNTPAQWAALACFTPENLEICEQRREIFRDRRDFMLRALPEAGISIDSSPDSAFYIYAKSPFNSNDYCRQLLMQEGVCTVPGHDFSEHSGEKMLRLSYANSMDRLQAAIEGIQRFNSRCRQP
ncbi:MAG TPA: aminotransferase class I/II-fold pyridoxal phosphate-dependent enzyme [Limnobacter sp.]|nr:aminotransferase class I/II-fold pyridoxal phosphate-dependent enzyme [Limnobacter sp.]